MSSGITGVWLRLAEPKARENTIISSRERVEPSPEECTNQGGLQVGVKVNVLKRTLGVTKGTTSSA